MIHQTVATAGLLLACAPSVRAITAEEARQIANRLVEGSGVQAHQAHEGAPFHFTGPEAESLSIDIDQESGVVRSFYWGRKMAQGRQARLSSAQAQASAEKWLDENRIKRDAPFLLRSSQLIDHGGGGIVHLLQWAKVVNGIDYPSLIHVEVSAATGEVVSFFVVDHAVTLKNLVPAISAAQAIDAVRARSNRKSWVGSARLFITPQQVLEWSVELLGQENTEYTPERGQYRVDKFVVADVDAQTGIVNSFGTVGSFQVGLVRNGKRIQLRPPVPRPKWTSAVHFWPSWRSGGGLVFQQWTEQQDAPASKPRPSYRSALMSQAGSSTSLLVASPQFIITNPAWAERTQRIAFGDVGGTLYILDLKSGTLGLLSDPERVSREMPAWDSTGRLLATAGTHSPSDNVQGEEFDQDIFVSRVQDKLSIISGRDLKCVAALAGRDTLPTWTPDDKIILFAHQEPSQTQLGAWSVQRVRSDVSRLAKEYQPPQIVAKLPAEPERLSAFPDGKRLLISYLDNEYTLKHPPQVLDTATKSLRALKWPVLRDPSLPKGQSLIPRDLAVSPDGTRVAFRALRWSGDPKDGGAICIYSCKLDGSGLKRVTSPTSTPAPMHPYPQPGVTALNALEKLRPKHNEGVLMSPGS